MRRRDLWSEMEDKGKDSTTQEQGCIALKPGFFVPVHPLLAVGQYLFLQCFIKLPVICYGLYLTFAAAACPASPHCLPAWLPLATTASHLGTLHPAATAALALVAAGLHIAEAGYAVILAR